MDGEEFEKEYPLLCELKSAQDFMLLKKVEKIFRLLQISRLSYKEVESNFDLLINKN